VGRRVGIGMILARWVTYDASGLCIVHGEFGAHDMERGSVTAAQHKTHTQTDTRCIDSNDCDVVLIYSSSDVC